MLTKIINEETKEVLIINQQEAKDLPDLVEMEVEQDYCGRLFVKGFAPEKPQEVKKQEIRAVRNQYLADTDKYMITDFPITEEERAQYRDYRQYLRNYPETEEDWYERPPMTFEEWRGE